MSCASLTQKYAPDLLDLAIVIDANLSKIARYSAGPVPGAKIPGETEAVASFFDQPHIILQLNDFNGTEAFIMIVDEEDCCVFTSDDAPPSEITFQEILSYLSK